MEAHKAHDANTVLQIVMIAGYAQTEYVERGGLCEEAYAVVRCKTRLCNLLFDKMHGADTVSWIVRIAEMQMPGANENEL